MSESRLSNLELLFIERDLTESTNFNDVVETFAGMKKRKTKFKAKSNRNRNASSEIIYVVFFQQPFLLYEAVILRFLCLLVQSHLEFFIGAKFYFAYCTGKVLVCLSLECNGTLSYFIVSLFYVFICIGIVVEKCYLGVVIYVMGMYDIYFIYFSCLYRFWGMGGNRWQ